MEAGGRLCCNSKPAVPAAEPAPLDREDEEDPPLLATRQGRLLRGVNVSLLLMFPPYLLLKVVVSGSEAFAVAPLRLRAIWCARSNRAKSYWLRRMNACTMLSGNRTAL